jgi:hypothetical protein
LAGAIASKDMSNVATKGDIRELELAMNAKFADSQKTIILWVAGIMIAQSTIAALIKVFI